MEDRHPISSVKLGAAIVFFSLATVFAFLESIGGSTGSPANKSLSIASYSSFDGKDFYYILTDGICSSEFPDGGCADLASFAESAAEKDKAVWALFLGLNSLSWIHIVSATWALLTTLVLIVSFFHHKRIYFRGDAPKITKTKDKREFMDYKWEHHREKYHHSHGKGRALHPLTKLSFCFA